VVKTQQSNQADRGKDAVKSLHDSRKEQRLPTRGFNMVLLGILLCVQIIGALLAVSQSKWIVTGVLLGLVALTGTVLRGQVCSRNR